MAKEKKPTKTKRDEQAQLLDLLRTILPKVAPDPAFAEKIYSAFEAELRLKNRAVSFEKFCERIPLPDLEAKTLEEVKQQLVQGFSDADRDWSEYFFDQGRGNRLPGVSGSLWAGFNGVTEWIDHRKTRQNSNRRLSSTWFSSIADIVCQPSSANNPMAGCSTSWSSV